MVGVTLREFVVLYTEDSGVEGMLGADGDRSEEESRKNRCDNLLVTILHSAVVTSFQMSKCVE